MCYRMWDEQAGKKDLTYGLDIVICQLANQGLHRVQSIIDALQQDALISHNHAVRKQLLRRLSRDPGELARVVEVRVHGDLLAHLLALLG